MPNMITFIQRRLDARDAAADEARVSEILERALAEPPFLDRERQAVSIHLDSLRGDVERIEGEMARHQAALVSLRAELDERHLAIAAHEAAEAVLAQSERREAAE